MNNNILKSLPNERSSPLDHKSDGMLLYLLDSEQTFRDSADTAEWLTTYTVPCMHPRLAVFSAPLLQGATQGNSSTTQFYLIMHGKYLL